MLVEIGIADAYGRAFEFNTGEFIKNNNNGKTFALRDSDAPEMLGLYTDDTQMSMALAEHLIEGKNFNLVTLAESFNDTFWRDPHMGYSKRMIAAFQEANNGKSDRRGNRFFNACQTLNLVNSNGTVMRSVPLGVLPDEGFVIRAAQIQSLITHCSFDASMCSQLIALISHYYYYDKNDKECSIAHLYTYLCGQGFKEPWEMCMKAVTDLNDQPVPCDAKATTGAIIKVLTRSITMREILVKSVAFGGDVDSIAAVAAGIGSLVPDIKNNISHEMINGLENGQYGFKYLKKLDRELLKKFPRS